MLSMYLVLGFIIIFSGIGFLVFHRDSFIQNKSGQMAAKVLLFLLAFFVSIYGIGLSCFIIVSQKEISGTVRILSCFLFTCTILWGLKASICFFYKNENMETVKADLKECFSALRKIGARNKDRWEKEAEDTPAFPRLAGKDWLFMGMLTLAGTFLIFFRLGSFSVPESFMVLDASMERGDEIVLDFGEEIEVQELCLFLGHMEERIIAVSYFDEAQEEWKVIQEDSMAESVYNWGTIEIDKKLRYLGLVARDQQAIFNELVILDKDGEKVLPVNAARYPELFDEQELYPEHNSYYYGTMFDEVYYARSAYELLQGMDTYEWTHPPLSKIFMAAGVYLFGVTPFGWRCICALAGVLLLPVMYLWLFRMTGKTKYAGLATALVLLDFMHLTLSRIATIDSIVALFIMLMFTLMYSQLSRWKQQIRLKKGRISGKELLDILAGAVVTGIACACKWTGFYGAAGIAVLFLVSSIRVLYRYRGNKEIITGAWKRVAVTGGSYLTGLVSVYVMSYIPMARAKGVSAWQAAVNNSLEMFRFHSVITFDHPYDSPWYSWLFDWVPLVDAGSYNDVREKVSMVVTMGNPIIWWCGLIALVYVLYRACFYGDKKAGYLSFAYFSMLVPWMFITRTVFIYQYYTCALILAGILAYTLQYLEQSWKSAHTVLLEASLVCFILFYPLISGIEINAETIVAFMEWLPRWRFFGK